MIKAKIDHNVIAKIVASRRGTYVTGSFIIGGATVESDIDIVVPIDYQVNIRQLELITERLGGFIKDSGYNNGYKLIFPALTTINILTLHPLDYAAFMFATDTMRCSPVIIDRNARHRCFEELCHAYKSFINPACTCIEEMYKVYERHASVGFMAEHIDWDNFYARRLPEI